MRKVFILYENFYTPDGKKMSIGGIQTYIKLLIKVINKMNLTPVVYQYANQNFEKNFNGVNVYGVKMRPSWSKRKKNKVLFDKCQEQYNPKKDVIIFACETMSIKNTENRVIGIQHGITWDVRGHEHYSHPKNLMFIFWRAIMAYRTAKRLNNVRVLVGVDYNFLNWYRTQVAYIEKDVKVIPNATDIKHNINKRSDNNIKIIFARRFQKYRGSRLFASVVSQIINKYDNVQITFAGSGPDELYLKKLFQDTTKVNFITYESEKSLEVHEKYDIAVIPTIGSEGTSLSLLEAMASKCAVVATNVGGMTNIILDHYNGLLINPEEKSLYEAIEMLIIDKELRDFLAENAYETVSQAFNKNLWEKRWEKLLLDIMV
ncbi:MAG: glycosyltransferase family 4 protein [Ectobacillus sp.]